MKAYCELIQQGHIVALRTPPDKALGVELRLAGATTAVFMYMRKEWWVPYNEWPHAQKALSDRYTIVRSALLAARDVETSQEVTPSRDEPDAYDIYTALVTLGIRLSAPDCVVHASWRGHLDEPNTRDYLKTVANAYLDVCKVRGLQPDMTAIQTAKGRDENGR